MLSQLAAWAERSKPDLKGSGGSERQKRAGKSDAEDGNVSEKPGRARGQDASREEDGKRGEAQHLITAAPNNVPLFPQPGTCCQRQGGRWGNGGRRGLEAALWGRTVGRWGAESPLGCALLLEQPGGS